MGRIATSQTPLAASASYTDTIFSAPGDGIVGAVFADQAGTLFIEQSLDDGATWPISTSIAVTASTAATFVEPVYVSRCRLRYVNGGSTQTTFRLVARSVSASYSS